MNNRITSIEISYPQLYDKQVGAYLFPIDTRKTVVTFNYMDGTSKVYKITEASEDRLCEVLKV